MDWERAKTILIIMLIFLNSGLFGLNYYDNQKKLITDEEIQTIRTILADNGIIAQCEFPSSNGSARLITVEGVSWDADYLKNVFFADNPDITRTNEAGNVIYRSGDKIATVVNALSDKKPVVLTYTEPLSGLSATPRETAALYKAKMGERFNDFYLSRVTIDDGKETFVYNEIHGDKPVFCSYLQIEASENLLTVTAKKYDFVSYVDGINQVYRADEALLAFMHFVDDILDEKITIERYDLGYDIDEQSSTDVYKAKLYYRFFVMGWENPVYVDAVTNTVVEID